MSSLFREESYWILFQLKSSNPLLYRHNILKINYDFSAKFHKEVHLKMVWSGVKIKKLGWVAWIGWCLYSVYKLFNFAISKQGSSQIINSIILEHQFINKSFPNPRYSHSEGIPGKSCLTIRLILRHVVKDNMMMVLKYRRKGPTMEWEGY